MIVHTDYLWFNTPQRREFVSITDEVAAIVTDERRRRRAWCWCRRCTSRPACTSTTGKSGLIEDIQAWLEKLAPAGLDYRHHRTGEDNGDAHLKSTLMGHQVVLPDHGRAPWTWARGSRCSTPSSTGSGRSASW